jgi:hypothetical protein
MSIWGTISKVILDVVGGVKKLLEVRVEVLELLSVFIWSYERVHLMRLRLQGVRTIDKGIF